MTLLYCHDYYPEWQKFVGGRLWKVRNKWKMKREFEQFIEAARFYAG